MCANIGYVYAMVHPLMPDCVKVGMTLRDPNERLSEANRSYTFVTPQFDFLTTKCVINPKEKEATLHKILETIGERVHERREFFKIRSYQLITDIFLLFDEATQIVDMSAAQDPTVVMPEHQPEISNIQTTGVQIINEDNKWQVFADSTFDNTSVLNIPYTTLLEVLLNDGKNGYEGECALARSVLRKNKDNRYSNDYLMYSIKKEFREPLCSLITKSIIHNTKKAAFIEVLVNLLNNLIDYKDYNNLTTCIKRKVQTLKKLK